MRLLIGVYTDKVLIKFVTDNESFATRLTMEWFVFLSRVLRQNVTLEPVSVWGCLWTVGAWYGIFGGDLEVHLIDVLCQVGTS